MSLNDFFDIVYCINLPRRTDRWEATQQECQRIGVTVWPWDAVDGEAEARRSATSNYEWWGDNSSLLPGEVGILRTHWGLLRTLDEGWGGDAALILEDDVEFSPTFVEDWEEWSKEIPDDWDMLYLGGNLVGWKPDQVTEHVHRAPGVFAIHALGLRNTMFQRLRDAIWQDGCTTPVDAIYARVASQCNSYIMVPRMAFQRPDYSDIQNKTANYWFLRRGQWSSEIGDSV